MICTKDKNDAKPFNIVHKKGTTMFRKRSPSTHSTPAQYTHPCHNKGPKPTQTPKYRKKKRGVGKKQPKLHQEGIPWKEKKTTQGEDRWMGRGGRKVKWFLDLRTRGGAQTMHDFPKKPPRGSTRGGDGYYMWCPLMGWLKLKHSSHEWFFYTWKKKYLVKGQVGGIPLFKKLGR